MITNVRTYVFSRETGICRCCRRRPAESLHELIGAGAMGSRLKATNPHNSVAVCGRLGNVGCHGHLQRHEIHFEGDAEGVLVFTPITPNAHLWMKGLP